MGDYLITIDGGTTNTRAFLWNGRGEILRKTGEEVGVRNTAMDGHNGRLRMAVKDCLERLLEEEGIGWSDIRRIVASGMLSSDVGIAEVPHIAAPASIRDFVDNAAKVMLPDICPLPISIVPGMKNSAAPRADEFEAMDIMRGEETESMPLIQRYGGGGPLLLVLPGSHNKFISVDAEGMITGCVTTISGELLSCITTGTILANAVGKRFVSETEYDKEMVLKGSRIAQKTGLGRACFSGRILNLFFKQDKAAIANYLLGAVCGEDVRAVLGSAALKMPERARIVIAGKKPLSTAMADVVADSGAFGDVAVVPDDGIPLAALGAYLVATQMKEAQ